MDYNGVAIRVKGKVQGVGFRPFVWALANKLHLTGNVSNDGNGVLVRLRYLPEKIEPFINALTKQCPPLANINTITTHYFNWQQLPRTFTIIASQTSKMDTLIVPDAATCKECLNELKTKEDRRYQYPFINCTQCGPRFTIIKKMPYDRPNTVMAKFILCAVCQNEYSTPSDRRFHAQPTACPNCGPKMWVSSANGNVLTEQTQTIDLIAEKMRLGEIIAIKGIGGFHLSCDATQDKAILTLRQRKQRPHKPFAIMLPDESWLSRCIKSDVDVDSLIALLKSPAAPIVLVPINPNSPISNHVAPDLNEIGVMLPSNPLHHLLLSHYKNPVVMTSGNANSHPPALSNQEALSTLNAIADYWLLHDRDITQRADDSVVQLGANKPKMLRRARGYVPDVLHLPDDFNNALTILAMGSDRKSTFCLLKASQAIVSQHFGELTTLNGQQQFQKTIDLWQTIYQANLDLIAVDAHPNYITHQLGLDFSKQLNIPFIPIYHHHAHIAACLAEYRYPLNEKPVVAIVLDGLGYGQNDKLWGGECLIADYKSCQYFGGLPSVAMPGGDLAAKEPWRNLLAHLITFVPNWQLHEEIRHIPAKKIPLITKAIQQKLNSPSASSAGRLFDAIASALGVAPEKISWEGEAACKLEHLASQYQGQPPAFNIPLNKDMTLDLHTFWNQWLTFKAGPTKKAFAFHVALANGLSHLAKKAAQENNLTTIVLTGGVMQNQLLKRLTEQALTGYRVLSPYQFPANDGGISLGQSMIACALTNAKNK